MKMSRYLKSVYAFYIIEDVYKTHFDWVIVSDDCIIRSTVRGVSRLIRLTALNLFSEN